MFSMCHEMHERVPINRSKLVIGFSKLANLQAYLNGFL